MASRSATSWLETWNPKFLFRRIESKEDARKILRDIGIGFYFVAGLQFVVGILLIRSLLTDSVGFLIIGYCLHKFRSRTAAIAAVGITLIGIVVTARNFVTRQGPTNIVLALLLLVYSIRAVQASFAYHKLAKSRFSAKNFLIKNAIGILFTFVFGFIALVGLAVVVGNTEKLTDEFWGGFSLVILLLSFGLAYRGWLPFTRRRPFVMCDEMKQ